jgi:galactokinase
MTSGATERLVAAGLRPAEAERKAKLFDRARLLLERWETTAASSQTRLYVPGRIEVLGKHTDYAGGRSLLCTVERGICVVASRRSDRLVRIVDAVREQECQVDLSSDADTASQDWTVYPTTVARRMARNFGDSLRGANIVFASDLPPSAGLSSSSALVVATFLALRETNDLIHHPAYRSNIATNEVLATYLACVENGQSFLDLAGDSGVGTFGGSEDHTAILCCRARRLSQFRFCPARLEREIPLSANCAFIIGVSGVVADKTGSAREKYNRAALAAKTILTIWNKASGRSDPTLFDAATHAPDAPDHIRRLLRNASSSSYKADALLDRFEQFLNESTCYVPEAANAVARNDFEEFGKWIDRSQAAAEQQLGNQVAETVELARSARTLGAIAASAFGAGFGGSVWAMVQSNTASNFLNDWKEHYHERFPSRAESSEFLVSGAGAPAVLF